MKLSILMVESLLICLACADVHADFVTEATSALEQKAKIMGSFSAEISNATNVEQVAVCVNALRGELNTLAKNVEAPFEAKYSDELGEPPPKVLQAEMERHGKVIFEYITVLRELKYGDEYKADPLIKEAIQNLERESAQISAPRRDATTKMQNK
jgi:hypothetical protein